LIEGDYGVLHHDPDRGDNIENGCGRKRGKKFSGERESFKKKRENPSNRKKDTGHERVLKKGGTLGSRNGGAS